MIRDVLRMGDPRLLLRAQPLDTFDTPELHALIADMLDTMRHLDGVGRDSIAMDFGGVESVCCGAVKNCHCLSFQ